LSPRKNVLFGELRIPTVTTLKAIEDVLAPLAKWKLTDGIFLGVLNVKSPDAAKLPAASREFTR